MNNNDFDDLLLSIEQAGKIKKGTLKPERVFHFDPVDIKTLERIFINHKPILPLCWE